MVKKGPSQKDEKYGGPTKAMSSYFLWCNGKRAEVMAQLREENKDDFKISQVGSKLGELWKSVSPEEKAPLEKLAKEQKEAYNTAFAAWKETDKYKLYIKDNAQFGKKKADKKARDEILALGMPKRPHSVWNLYTASKRVEVQKEIEAEGLKAAVSLVSKRIGVLWKNVPEDEKKALEEQAAALKTAYNAKMEEFKKTDAYLAYEKGLVKNSKALKTKLGTNTKKRTSKKKASGEPAKKKRKVQDEEEEPQAEESPEEAEDEEESPNSSEEGDEEASPDSSEEGEEEDEAEEEE